MESFLACWLGSAAIGAAVGAGFVLACAWRRRIAGSSGRTRPGRRHRAMGALTRREREVSALAADGRSNAEIAAQLGVSVRTVESHLYHAMPKLGVGRRGELSQYGGHQIPVVDTDAGHQRR